ncbi:unnamed protein product [Lepidochelys kempii]
MLTWPSPAQHRTPSVTAPQRSHQTTFVQLLARRVRQSRGRCDGAEQDSGGLRHFPSGDPSRAS